jgi:hypothetical protein
MTFSEPPVTPPVSDLLPLPTFNLPAYLPVNGTLAVDYPALYSDIGFQWTVTLNASAGSLITAAVQGGAGRPAAPSASFKTRGHTASLADYSLAPGSYVISVQAFDASGRTSPTAQAPVTLVAADLGGARVYPNPWRADKYGGVPVTFDRLPLDSAIKLFTISGHLIKTLSSTAGSIQWSLDNDSGRPAASGIYLYLISTPDGQKTRGKLAVIK